MPSMTFLLHFVNLYAALLLGQHKSEGERTAERGLRTRSVENAVCQERIPLKIPE